LSSSVAEAVRLANPPPSAVGNTKSSPSIVTVAAGAYRDEVERHHLLPSDQAGTLQGLVTGIGIERERWAG
jgi:hypothetical protein